MLKLSWSHAKSKRGIFFALDVVLAITILVVGVVIIFSTYLDTPTYGQARSLSFTMMEYFTNTRIEQVNSPYVIWLSDQGIIASEKDSIVVAMGRMYHDGNEFEIWNLTRELSDDGRLIIEPFEFALLINNTLIYNSTDVNTIPVDRTVLPAKKVIVGLDENDDLWGPYIAEVLVW